MNTRQIGNRAEDAAVAYILAKGAELLVRNYTTPYGEADAIFIQNGQYVFAEVKARRSLAHGTPAMAVTRSKMKRYMHIAQYYFMENKIEDYFVRFDVVEVYITSGEPYINHIENAFDFSDFDDEY